MTRPCLLLCCLVTLVCAEGHGFVLKDAAAFTYSLKSRTDLTTAGDTLSYETWMVWKIGLFVAAIEADTVTLSFKINKIRAGHRGGGTEHSLDSKLPADAAGSGDDDKLLGNLRALVGVPLTLTIDRRTGQVHQVEGLDALHQKVAARAPSNTDEDSALTGPAQQVYSPELMTRMLSEMFKLPVAGDERVDLGLGGGATASRRWQDNSYTLTLPDGDPPAIRLHRSPTPVTMTLTALDGSGEIRRGPKGFNHANGTFTATIEATASTQPVRLQLSQSWQLGRLEQLIPQAPAAADKAAARDGTTP